MIINDRTKRHDFVLLFDVTDGNPNGDPDNNNEPRKDEDTLQGLVSDVAIKRKVRDYIDRCYDDEEGYTIYIRHGDFLTNVRRGVAERNKFPLPEIEEGEGDKKAKKAKTSNTAKIKEAKAELKKLLRTQMIRDFYDIRMFGAVMSMDTMNAGQVYGPLQLTFARTIDPIEVYEASITRIVQEKPGNEGDISEHGTFGNKFIVPYGLYRGYGFFDPFYAADNNVTETDLERFWKSLQLMWGATRSATRGMMSFCGLYIFTHESPYGNGDARELFNTIQVTKQSEGVPRSLNDYTIRTDETRIPDTITLTSITTTLGQRDH
jgi:CRISPR-associated protein Csd2